MRPAIRRVAAAILLLAAIIALPAAQAAPPAAPRIVAVGDLHGDADVWTDIARAAGIMNAAGHWSGGTTTLVQLGDIADRGADTLKIISSLRQLQREAPAAGGKVIVVLGNHEAMNLTGDLRYVTAAEFAAFSSPQSAALRDHYYAVNKLKIEAAAHAVDASLSPAAIRDRWYANTPIGWVEHREAWGPAGTIGRWVRTNPAIARVGDTLFVHGGISAEQSKVPLDQVNRRIAAALAKSDSGPSSILFDALGPLWYRGLVAKDADAQAERASKGTAALSPEAEVDAVLAAYGAKRLVVAHTPNLKGIMILMGGKLARIDTGNSRYYGGQPSWLEISGDKMVAHNVTRSKP